VNIIDAVLHLWSFSHAACDSALQARHIEVMNVNLRKGPADASLYGGSAFLAIWYVIILMSAVWAWRNRGNAAARGARTGIYAFPVLAVIGLVGIWAQGNAVIDYVTTCRSLLGIR
jgi:hypothetical protein